ncbi:phage tail protein [uncultured Endozoicomonas sp.]|uniref:phage tail protein n=1 Tax=uncultured Endozoicomonas sp. TaxID=432652 RepID=UPI0026110F58|nr:phage tail protein [uncultured Endozoicomonas sp.]
MADNYDYHLDNLPGAPTRAKLNDNFENIKNNKSNKAETDQAIADLQSGKLGKTEEAADSAKLGGLPPSGYASNVHSHGADDLPVATLNAPGVVQILDSVTSASTVMAAAPNSVKTAMDRADSAYGLAGSAKNIADDAFPAAGGNLAGGINYTPNTGNIITLDNKTVLYRHTANGAISFGADEAVVIGSGEARNLTVQNVTMTSEVLHLSSDNEVVIRSNLQGGWSGRKEFVFEDDGGLKVPNNLKTLRNLGLRPIYVGELCRFSFEMPADGLPGFFALDGSRIVGGAVEPAYKPLIDSGCRFITIDGNDLILADAAYFGRGKGSSSRAVGSFQEDAIRNIKARIDNYYNSIYAGSATGAITGIEGSNRVGSGSGAGGRGFVFDASRVVPTASENRPKSLTELVCVYHGVF